MADNYVNKTLQYKDYLVQHIDNVKRAYDWLTINLPDLFDSEKLGLDGRDILVENIYSHDQSKYSDEEFLPYADYFYGTRSEKVDKEFDYAWLHHIHNNPHHWQYWLLREDEGTLKALDMPFEYICEMICDWWAFSWKSGNLYEIFNWYEKNKSKQELSENTRKEVERILAMIKEKLDEEKVEE